VHLDLSAIKLREALTPHLSCGALQASPRQFFSNHQSIRFDNTSEDGENQRDTQIQPEPLRKEAQEIREEDDQ
jgi:hypothetical protein